MGDVLYHPKPEINDYVEYLYKNQEGKMGGSFYKNDVIWDKYKVRLLKWEPSDPIENSFE